MPYGLVVSVPIAVPLAKNLTLLIVPSASLAVAAIGTLAGAGKLAPEAGAVIDTAGG
jgi:hypothetical protein